MANNLPQGWIKGGKYFVEHISGRWRVSRSKIRGGWAYTLWKRLPKAEHWGLYGNYDSVVEADRIVQNPPTHRLNRK